MPNPLYDELFARYAGRTDDFLLFPDGTSWSYERFLATAAQLAHVLTGHGLTAGDRVAVQVEKSPEGLAVYAACVQAGLIFLPLNIAYTPDEVAYFVDNSGAKVLVCDSKNAAALGRVASGAGARLETLNADGAGTLMDAANTQPTSFETVQRDMDDLAAFLYTSGTTGRSKGGHAHPRKPAVKQSGVGRALALQRGRRVAARPADFPHPWTFCRHQCVLAGRRQDDFFKQVRR